MPQTFLADADVSNPGGWRREIKHDGTAQAGGATTITLDTGASAVDDEYNSDVIEITSGTGSGQTRTITDYVGSTKVATVAAWSTNPDATSVFEIREVALWPALDADLATYIESPSAPSDDLVQFGVSGGVDPNSTGLHRTSLTVSKDIVGGARIDIEWELFGGGGLITTETFVDIAASETELTHDLTSGEIAAILQADYEGDLETAFTATQV